VERENRILLEKMQDIINKKAKQSKSLQNKQAIYNKESTPDLTRPSIMSNAKQKLYPNEIYRKREFDRIQKENEKLLKRLQSKKSSFNIEEWDL